MTRAYVSRLLALVVLLAPPVVDAGIARTKHNLTGTEEGPVQSICIFCHTPAGDPNAAVEPTWTETGTPGSTFETFDDLGRLDPNRDGVTGTVSVACLSCHDGAQALSVTTMELDHPVGVAYRGAVVSGIDLDNLPETSTDATGEITFIAGSENAPERLATSPQIFDSAFRPTTFGVIDDSPTWWIDTGVEGRQRTDIKLYSRYYGEQTAVPFVECASCHDPHSEAQTFLRIENHGSALCLGCHDL